MVPPLIVFAAVKATQHYPEIFSIRVHVPTYALVIAMFFSFPLSLFLKTLIQDWKDEREAKRHGAVLPPIVKSKWPAGLDLLLNGIKKAPTEYTGILFSIVLVSFKFVKANLQAIVMRNWHKNMDTPSTSNFCSRTGYDPIFNRPCDTEINSQSLQFFTAEPEHIKAMLATQFDNYEKGMYSLLVQHCVWFHECNQGCSTMICTRLSLDQVSSILMVRCGSMYSCVNPYHVFSLYIKILLDFTVP